MIRASVTTAPYLVNRRTRNNDYDLIARKTQMDNILLIPGLDRPNPNNLFRDGQVGGWLDPYDLTKMWVDNAGTTPMTASDLGVGIGRIQTKGGPVITFEQATSGDRPVWGRHPVSGINNVLERSEEFDNAYWVKINVGVTPNTTTAPDGTLTADTVLGTAAGSTNLIRATDVSCIASRYTASLHCQAGTASTMDIILRDVTALVNQNVTASILSGPGSVSVIGGTTVAVSGLQAGQWTRISVTTDSAITAGNLLRVQYYPETVTGGSTTGKSVILWGAQLRAGTTAGTYQRVTNRFDITETGQSDLYYFSGNGVNQRWRSAANLDLSGVNVLTVWAGVRTNQGSTRAAIYSHNTDAVNFSQLEAPGFTSNNYEFSVRTGLTCPIADSPYNAPTTDALVGVHNRDARQLWRNGSLVDTGTGDSGANNLPNAPLDIFYRGSGPDRFFNGNMYSFIIAGDNYDTRTIQQFSDWSLKPRRLITA